MSRTRVALSALLFAFAAGATSLSAQGASMFAPGSKGGFELEQNYPNPFNPETTIPFVLGPDVFRSGSAVVSLRIYNLLQQLVAVPVALGHPGGEGVGVQLIQYAQPGRYEAFWNGNDLSGRQVASGIYFVQLTVNGVSTTRKMFVLK